MGGQMAAAPLNGGPTRTEVVIVGNGPSSLILSYILHGHIPYYDLHHPHPDPILHRKLKDASEGNAPLLPHDIREIRRLTEHFPASTFSYSSQALPVNALFDALRRPAGEDELGNSQGSSIRWEYHPELAVPHLVFGDSDEVGGQWARCPRGTRSDVQSLSYSGQLSLPGYSFFHHKAQKASEKGLTTLSNGTPVSISRETLFLRPGRHEMADYLASYPAAVGISNSFRSEEHVSGLRRLGDSFFIASHNLVCQYIVLATGTLTEDKPPPELLRGLGEMPLPAERDDMTDFAPILVIGSGFSAADAIISASPRQKIIHIFQWDPDHNPSPLAAGHSAVYPMSSGIYRLMRAATHGSKIHVKNTAKESPMIAFLESRDWNQIYEGIPNATVVDVNFDDEKMTTEKGRTATITIALQTGGTISQRVSGLIYATGRRGRLDYLDEGLRDEVFGRECLSSRCSPHSSQASDISSVSSLDKIKDSPYVTTATLRGRAIEDLEIAPRVFVIGSLTGDSLVRYADGSCIYAASKIMYDIKDKHSRI